MAELSEGEARDLVRAVVELAQMAERALPPSNALAQRLRDHLGLDGDDVPNTSARFELIERANLQLALEELRDEADVWEEIGLSPEIGHYSGVSLPGIVSGSFRGPTGGARQYVSVDVTRDRSIQCLRTGIVVTEFEGTPVLAMVVEVEHRARELVLELAAPTQELADRFLRHLRERMTVNNVLRGKVLTFSFGEYGNFGLTFASVPAVTRDQVILPAWQLEAIEEHARSVTDAGDALRAAGQHLKRGLLLYGPPGTGKTHTVSYLVSQMTDRTTILLSGASVGAVGQAGTLARKLAPATIVIEDVDLIGMDRGLPGGEHNPMLFQLLNEMDGLHDDDDVLFVLTTNRADLLEPALAARPGRVDQAIEIDVPDDDGRRALFELYLDEPVADGAMSDAVERTDGAAAAYIKEICRRAVLRRVRTGEPLDQALRETVTTLDATATPLLRASLAAHAAHHFRPIPAAGPASHPDG